MHGRFYFSQNWILWLERKIYCVTHREGTIAGERREIDNDINIEERTGDRGLDRGRETQRKRQTDRETFVYVLIYTYLFLIRQDEYIVKSI